jgi:Kef-type K+ transport system membrane component KefB
VVIPYRALVVLLGLSGLAIFLASAFLGTANRPESQFGDLVAAIALIIVVGRGTGELVARLGQPRVMGEVLGGIILGPSLIGALPAVIPQICGAHTACPPQWPFSGHTVDGLTAGAEIGLAFYMFLIGLELDPAVLRERFRQAVAISATSIVLPFALGAVAAVLLLGEGSRFGDQSRPLAFTIFMGVSMSITAFPVLARILVERRMIRGPIGALALACAAIDDVIAWGLLAMATAAAIAAGAVSASPGTITGGASAALAEAPHPLAIIVLAIAFCAAMGLLARPVLARLSEAYEEAGHVPAAWLVAVFVGVLLAAFLSQRVGIAAIFGAFVLGLVMPRRSGLSNDISGRLEDFVVVVLLPLFFVVSGLRTNVRALIDQPELWGWTLVLIGIAIGGKWLGASVAARLTGVDGRSALAIGALMNTRGLTELIVLNVGLTLGVISTELFTMLVVMALVTTFMAGPALRLIDRAGRLSVSPEQEVTLAGPGPLAPAAILVACQDPKNLASLASLAEALATTGAPREVILVRLVQPSRLTTRYGPQQRIISAATDALAERSTELRARGIQVRAVALTSVRLEDDLLRLARDQRVDLVLTDGRRSLTRDGVPGGPVGALLEGAECDVAVLVERRQPPMAGPDHPVLVPFGGSDHDWAAVELGAWLAQARGARLRLLGLSHALEGRDAGGLLASAALAVQGLSGVEVEPVLVEPGRASILRAGADAGLLVVGLSRRWRDEGLGEMRRAIALESVVPTLFMRRGSRGGALAAAESMTNFRWSSTALGRGE